MTAILFCLTAPSVRAATLEEAIPVEDVNRAAGAYLEEYLDLGAEGGTDWEEGAKVIVRENAAKFPGLFRQALGSGILLLAAAMACGIAESAGETLTVGGLAPARLAGAAAVALIATADVNTLMGLGRETLEQMDTFSKILLPTVTAACAATGAPVAAAARQGATLLFLNLLLTVAERLLLPLLYAYVAMVTAHAALGNDGLKRLAGFLKWGTTGFLTLLFTGFVLYLSITGAVAGSADALTQKAAKTALSSMVPVVGGILSDAAETVAAGAGMLKGTVGVVGLLAVLAICAGPFLRLGVHYLVYKGIAALSATAAPGPLAGLIDAIGSAFALMMGVVGGGGLILYVALITAMQAVGS